jgi:hypothetical protein
LHRSLSRLVVEEERKGGDGAEKSSLLLLLLVPDIRASDSRLLEKRKSLFT